MRPKDPTGLEIPLLRAQGHKRSASSEPPEVPSGAQPRCAETETLFCQSTLEDLSHLHCSHVESLMAAFLQQRAQKEIPASGNDSELQERVDQAKVLEWETVHGKSAVKVWTGAKAEEIKSKSGHRFIKNRFVVTNKTDEDGSRIKARWALLGHGDPDFREKIMSGECHSKTLTSSKVEPPLSSFRNHQGHPLGDPTGSDVALSLAR